MRRGAIDPRTNPDAVAIFRRDLTRLCQYFARQGVRRDPLELAEDLWMRHALAVESEAPIELEAVA